VAVAAAVVAAAASGEGDGASNRGRLPVAQPRLAPVPLRSEAALPPPDPTTAPLVLERLLPEAGLEPPVWSARPRRRSVLGDVDAERSTTEILAVELLDRRIGLGVVRELDEGDPARTARLAVDRQVDVDDLSRRRQELRQVVLGGLVAEVADENSGRNRSPPAGNGPAPSGRGPGTAQARFIWSRASPSKWRDLGRRETVRERARESRSHAIVERDTGFEPATFSLGS
jgi:hypothetical protein